MFVKNQPNVGSYHRNPQVPNICLSQGNNSMGPIEVMTPAKYA